MDSRGSSLETEAPETLRSAAYSYAVWLLVGAMAQFGMQIFILSGSVYADVLDVPLRNVGSFEANIFGACVWAAAAGFTLGLLKFPFRTMALELMQLATLMMMALVAMVNTMCPAAGKPVYTAAVCLGCMALGVMEAVGIVSLNDPWLPGRPSKRAIAFICGHPLGYLLLMGFQVAMHQSWFARVLDAFVTVGWAYMAYAITLFTLMALPVLVYVVRHTYPITLEMRSWQFKDLENSMLFYREALAELGSYAQYVAMAVVIQVAEGLLNTRMVLVLTNPIPDMDSKATSLIAAIGTAFSDLLGRAFIIMLRKIIAIRRRRWNELSRLEREEEVKVLANRLDVAKSVAETKVDELEEVKERKNILRFEFFMLTVWTVVGARVGVGVIMAVRQHYQGVAWLGRLRDAKWVFSAAMFSAFVHGFVLSYVYSTLFKLARRDRLDAVGVTLSRQAGEPDACEDMRRNAETTAALLAGVVRNIELLAFMCALYVGYKYNRLLYDAQLLRGMGEPWPTDHLPSNFCKLWWWLRNVGSLIWRDVRSPFGIF